MACESTQNNIVSNNKIVENVEEGIQTFARWEELDIPRNLLRGIIAYGFETPSPIQQKSIIPFNSGKDIIAQAQSGTGKTGAFTVGLLSRINVDTEDPQVLVLSPTRELSNQNYEVCTSLGQFMNVRTKLLVGGTSTDLDCKELYENRPHVIVGCPGRVHDMMRRNAFNYSKINCLVVDEADEMFSKGFKEQLYNIVKVLNKECQIALFSATIPSEFYEITREFMNEPTRILVKASMITLEGIKQFKVAVDDDMHKYETLKDIFGRISIGQCIIYCNSVRRVQDLTDAMTQDNFPVICIHSNMTTDERTEVIKKFRGSKYRFLISSDVTARGIDVQSVQTVINFDVPKSVHTYLHRIGRSGRWGRKGMGINFYTRRDAGFVRDIETYYATQIVDLPENFADKLKP